MAERKPKDDIENQDAQDVHPQRFVATGRVEGSDTEGRFAFDEGEIVDSSRLTEADLQALLSRGAIRPA